MAEHYRLTILKRLTAHLAGMTTDDGFTYDMADRVFRGRTEFGDEMGDQPWLSLIEAPRPDLSAIFATSNEARSEKWELLIQGWAKADDTNPTDSLYPLLGDTEARLAEILSERHTDTYMLGRDAGGFTYIVDLQVLPPVVRPPSSTPAAKACFYLPLRIGLARPVG